MGTLAVKAKTILRGWVCIFWVEALALMIRTALRRKRTALLGDGELFSQKSKRIQTHQATNTPQVREEINGVETLDWEHRL